MRTFECRWNNEGILESVMRAGDPHKTVYLTSFGEMELPRGVTCERFWEEQDERLFLTFTVKNESKRSVSSSDIRFLIEANTEYVRDDPQVNYFERVLQHACICGHSSFFYWTRPCGQGPHLALIATGKTALFADYNTKPYRVSAGADDLLSGEERRYTFTFLWIENDRAVQDALYEQGGVALDLFPGLTVPCDTPLLLAPKCRLPICYVKCPDAKISKEKGVYTLRFQKRGEHRVHIGYGEGLETVVECFSTRPVEELIALRARHIVKHQQYRGEKWYNGLFSQWNAEKRRMTTPDDYMELQEYMVSADDPGLCKAPYLAEKNVARPDPREIEAIEYYIEHFVWGGLQRTDSEEPYPYGIYGSESWKKNRESGTGYNCGGIGMERMWRTFDYTHLIQLYFNMYLIAKNYPRYVHYLDAQGYLERARRTALAYFEVPYDIFMHTYWAHHGYCDWAFKQGNFHERYILPLLDACGDEKLRYYWETKCKYMIYDHPLPYGSEMVFDTTAFESTQAVARYAMTHGLRADVQGWYDKNLQGAGQGGYRSHQEIEGAKEERFLHCQMAANLACRGTQMRSFYHLGSDYRAGGYKSYLLSYMTQMGGAAILDYALYFAKDPAFFVRTAYASLLAPWALVNLGEEDPYYPHPDNEGAVGWAWQPEEQGRCWDFMNCKRGPWHYDGEIDSGLSGAVCACCSVLINDPVFGLVCYGGDLEKREGEVVISPKDGVRRAFHDVSDPNARLHLALDRDALLTITKNEKGEMIVELENITADAHTATLTVNDSAYVLNVPKKKAVTLRYSRKKGVTLL